MSVADLDDDTITCAREAFTLHSHGQGSLSGADLYTALRCCAVNPTTTAIKSITEGAEDVDLEMFMLVVATTKTQGSGKDLVVRAFEAMDREKTGSVSAKELSAILTNSGEMLPASTVQAAISKYGGGDIPYTQLVEDIFSSVPVIAKAAPAVRTTAPSSAPPKKAAAPRATPKAAPAPKKAAPPPEDDFGGGFDDDDDDNDEFGF